MAFAHGTYNQAVEHVLIYFASAKKLTVTTHKRWSKTRLRSTTQNLLELALYTCLVIVCSRRSRDPPTDWSQIVHMCECVVVSMVHVRVRGCLRWCGADVLWKKVLRIFRCSLTSVNVHNKYLREFHALLSKPNKDACSYVPVLILYNHFFF